MSRYRQPVPTVLTVKEPSQPVAKIPYVDAQEVNDKMTKGQKEGIRVWNMMRDTLLAAGLMEEN